MKNRTKRMLTGALILCMVCATQALSFGAEPAAAGGEAYAYKNPQDLIIRAPELTYSTSASKISIYGASDYDYPVYMNNQPIETTEQGFFAQYVSLNVGVNTFVFTNNGKSKTVTITRKQASSGGSSSGGSSSNIKIWGASVTPKYGTVTGNNISRMAAPGTDETKLLMPLAKGTVAQLTGEAGNLYRLSDGTFVYKSNVTATDGTLQKTNITEAQFLPSTGNNCTELRFKMDKNALYNLEVSDSWAVLTVYNAVSSAKLPEITANKLLNGIELSDGGKSGNVVYSLRFKDNAPLNGYYVEFENGYMKVGFKERPVLNGTDLTGMRIRIDAGHGGTDTGSLGAASTFGPTEKQINLSVALSAQRYLESKGATVINTRTGDTTVGLAKRAAAVAAEKPDFCLSVHCNSMPVTADYNKVSGALTFYSFDHQEAAVAINDVITAELGISKSGPRHRNLAMTRMTAYPSVLIETALMSNPKDYAWLIDKNTQTQYGLAAGKAVERYLQSMGQLADVTVTIDGNPLQMDQPPVIKNDRTLVPLRAIFEALGAEVTWNEQTRTVTAVKGSTKVQLTVDSAAMQVNDGTARTVTLDVPAQLVNDRTMVPARAVSEALNAKVDWNGDTRTVIIEK